MRNWSKNRRLSFSIKSTSRRWRNAGKRCNKALKKRGYEAMAISAMTREGTKELLWKAVELLQTAPVPEPGDEPCRFTARPKTRKPSPSSASPEGWRVHSAALERAASMTYWEYEAPVLRFQKLIKTIGLDKALREAGVQEGDMVYIGDYELEWQD